MGLLEVLRFTLILGAVITLNQPEITQEYRPAERPALVVLYDVSESMQTEDVIDPQNPAAKPVSRSERVKPLLPDDQAPTDNTAPLPELWRGMSDKMEIVFEPFSSTLKDPTLGTDLNQALTAAAEQHANLQGVVLISDGDWNTGTTPAEAATALRMRDVPVFAVSVGSEERLPDVQLANIDAPTFGVTGKTIRIPFRINNWLPKGQNLNVRLSGTDGEVIEKSVHVDGMGQVRDTINWLPTQTGDYTLRLDIPVVDEEANPDNNSLEFPINIKTETLKVLIVESYPRWEYRYLRNALERDPGVDVHCLLFHPDLEGVGGDADTSNNFPAIRSCLITMSSFSAMSGLRRLS